MCMQLIGEDHNNNSFFFTCEADEPFLISANCESDMCMHSTGATEALNISLADQRNNTSFSDAGTFSNVLV